MGVPGHPGGGSPWVCFLATAGTAAVPLTELALAGDLACLSRPTVPDLRAGPQHEAAVTIECATSGTQRQRFTGPLLHDVLVRKTAGPGRRFP
ncbi:hypothetical protein PV726_36885 [Streptomyces europaeiscabiei]|uniref:hypothetical protein n=1 Tax=Streptomyces europaeiscabiei TaxID=146819 RepID=UPI0029A98379|nr:hypothetical protein [Streptomyces europaeiscabiei]MDX3695798.1 hypothetical protein [Streptomyces europaeiscabiei]